jgi:hypothetical protein
MNLFIEKKMANSNRSNFSRILDDPCCSEIELRESEGIQNSESFLIIFIYHGADGMGTFTLKLRTFDLSINRLRV